MGTGTKWRTLRKPFFRVYFKETARGFRVFQKIVVDSLVPDVAVRRAVDFLFRLVRGENADPWGELRISFEDKNSSIIYSVARD